MAGLGFKDFQVGEVLTSADVDGYLMQQSVMRFADSAARGSALGTAVGTGVPLAEGMVAYLDDVDTVQVFDGTGWKAVSAVLQIVEGIKSDTFTTTSSSFVDVTGLSATITPSSVASKVLVLVRLSYSANHATGMTTFDVLRGSSSIVAPTSPGSRTPAMTQVNTNGITNDGSSMWTASFMLLDAPASSSAQTYKVQVRQTNSQTTYINRQSTDTDNSGNVRGVSTVTLMEVAA